MNALRPRLSDPSCPKATRNLSRLGLLVCDPVNILQRFRVWSSTSITLTGAALIWQWCLNARRSES
jgi:hypothetical protein